MISTFTDYVSCLFFKSHEPPSRQSPPTYIPSAGFDEQLSLVYQVNLKLNTNQSIGIYFYGCLACYWRTPVRKPCGKKKLESQQLFVVPSSSQLLINITLYLKSFIQDAKGFKLGYDTFFQFSGTLFISKSQNIESNSSDMRMIPLIAFFISSRDVLMTFKSLLNL